MEKAILGGRMAFFVSLVERGPRWLLIRGDGAGLVVVNVEDGVELGELKEVVDLLREFEQFELGALIAGGGVGADHFAQARAVDVVDVGKVDQDVLLALSDEVANGISQLHAALAKSDPTAEVENGDAVNFTGSN